MKLPGFWYIISTRIIIYDFGNLSLFYRIIKEFFQNLID